MREERGAMGRAACRRSPPAATDHHPFHPAALKAVIAELQPGAKLVDVCVKGDAVIDE